MSSSGLFRPASAADTTSSEAVTPLVVLCLTSPPQHPDSAASLSSDGLVMSCRPAAGIPVPLPPEALCPAHTAKHSARVLFVRLTDALGRLTGNAESRRFCEG